MTTEKQFRDTEMEKIRQKLLRRCKELGVTKNELARRMNVNRRSIQRWLDDSPATHTYTVGTLCLFCQALNFESLRDLLNY